MTLVCSSRLQGWNCTQQFEGHSHFVMQVTFNPKDTNTFASASLDRTVKVWGLGQPNPNFTLEGHDKGVNCIDYFTGRNTACRYKIDLFCMAGLHSGEISHATLVFIPNRSAAVGAMNP